MIQEIQVKNYLSFRDEATFSFEATEDTFAEDCQVVQIDEKTRLLRFAIIYGYNASGKSNLLEVFNFLSDFWRYTPEESEKGTKVIPFKLDNDSPNSPSCFKLAFYVNTVKYLYHLELDTKQVYLEKLSYYKEEMPIMLFERSLNNEELSVIEFGTDNSIGNSFKELITGHCLKNMSFFAARDKVNVSLPLIDAAKEWMKTQIIPAIDQNTDLSSIAESMASKNQSFNEYITDFLKDADFNITKIYSKKTAQKIPNALVEFFIMNKNITDTEKKRIQDEKVYEFNRTIFEHTVENKNGKETYSLEKKEQSNGTIHTFGLEAKLYELINYKSVLTIDEIETSLHPDLQEKILYEYLKNHSRTQLIITTHNNDFLDLTDDLIRKDSIWFIEKDKSGNSDLYKLVDFKGIEKINSLRTAYRYKRFGATMK